MAGEGHGPSSTTDSPTSSGFNSDQLPPTCPTSANFTEDDYEEEEEEAAVDLVIICDEPKEDEEKDDGEDLFNDPFMESVSLFVFPFQFPPALISFDSLNVSICL